MRPLQLLRVLAGCASPLPELDLQRPVVLLGEVHDIAAGHALRPRAFDALVLEQFDAGDQPAIDEARRLQPRPDGRALVQAVLAVRSADGVRPHRVRAAGGARRSLRRPGDAGDGSYS